MKFGARPLQFAPASSTQRDLFRCRTTYLAKIAVILQDAPNKMLTFNQLMDKLGPLMCEERKSVENNIRVCLSANKCFVKIPSIPNSFGCKRNYWKLDVSQITTKMVRRHFKGILELFPELTSKLELENMSRTSESSSGLSSPDPPACRSVQLRYEVKFNSPFSIESLLKRDSPCPRAPGASPLSTVPVRVEQPLQPSNTLAGTKRSFGWDSDELQVQVSAGASFVCPPGGSTHHRLTPAKSLRSLHMYSEPSFPVYGASPLLTSSHSNYITYSTSTFPLDAHRFRL